MKIRMLEDVHGLVCGEAPNPAQLRAMARPTKPEPCKPGRRCERYARALGVPARFNRQAVEWAAWHDRMDRTGGSAQSYWMRTRTDQKNMPGLWKRAPGVHPCEAPSCDQWYLQDKRSYVGNDMLFWAAAGGYTTDVSKAQVFTREKAYSQHEQRDTDLPWPKAYIDSKTRPAVDMQYVKHAEALATYDVAPSIDHQLTVNKDAASGVGACHGCGRFYPVHLPGCPNGVGEADAPSTRAGWWCQQCTREVQPKEVTYEESHDQREGGCGAQLTTRTFSAHAHHEPEA